eukprot:gene3684-4107_t
MYVTPSAALAPTPAVPAHPAPAYPQSDRPPADERDGPANHVQCSPEILRGSMRFGACCPADGLKLQLTVRCDRGQHVALFWGVDSLRLLHLLQAPSSPSEAVQLPPTLCKTSSSLSHMFRHVSPSTRRVHGLDAESNPSPGDEEMTEFRVGHPAAQSPATKADLAGRAPVRVAASPLVLLLSIPLPRDGCSISTVVASHCASSVLACCASLTDPFNQDSHLLKLMLMLGFRQVPAGEAPAGPDAGNSSPRNTSVYSSIWPAADGPLAPPLAMHTHLNTFLSSLCAGGIALHMSPGLSLPSGEHHIKQVDTVLSSWVHGLVQSLANPQPPPSDSGETPPDGSAGDTHPVPLCASSSSPRPPAPPALDWSVPHCPISPAEDGLLSPTQGDPASPAHAAPSVRETQAGALAMSSSQSGLQSQRKVPLLVVQCHFSEDPELSVSLVSVCDLSQVTDGDSHPSGLKPEIRRQFLVCAETTLLLEEIYGLDDNEKECVVCQDSPSTVVLLPCRHLCICETCQPRLNSKCPMCRQTYGGCLVVEDHEMPSEQDADQDQPADAAPAPAPATATAALAVAP